MAPINLPGGSKVSEVILPDGTTASEVIAPDGSTVFSTIPDSLISRWKFEQSLADSVDGNDGTASNGSPSYSQTSAVGTYAINFTGYYVDTHNPSYSSHSISLWYNPDSLSGSNQWLAGNSPSLAIQYAHNPDELRWIDLNNGLISFSGKLSTDTYFMLTGTYDAETDDVALYLNDTQEATGTIAASSSSNPFRMGARATDGRNPADAQIDDVRLYDKALTPTEVSNLYNTGSIA